MDWDQVTTFIVTKVISMSYCTKQLSALHFCGIWENKKVISCIMKSQPPIFPWGCQDKKESCLPGMCFNTLSSSRHWILRSINSTTCRFIELLNSQILRFIYILQYIFKISIFRLLGCLWWYISHKNVGQLYLKKT